ncbi:MAG: bifunctional metallophosphatase/5'-nucleotidase [Synergistaceae bacterium]|nr:bifunctional metallophosphatase/5'-nucleotidase [Synergistaceae bacterium]
MRKVLALLLLAAVCLPAWCAVPDHDIVILYTNDVHCGVDQNIGYTGLTYYKHQMQTLTPYVTLVDAGDWSEGETIGMLSQGRYILEIMNAMNYDLAVPGNHEFDYGRGMFEVFAKDLKCGLISCNFRDLRTGELVLKPYRIFTYGDVRVAFVGVCTPESLIKSTTTTFMDEGGKRIYGFDEDTSGEKLIMSIQKAVDEARADGADFVIVVGHLGIKDVTDVWTSSYIAARTRGIDAFIDAHSHEVFPALMVKNADGKDTPITQSGTKLANIGKVTIDTNGAVKTELVASVQSRDEKITALVHDIKARYEDTVMRHLSYTSFDLRAKDENGKWLTREGENTLCDVAADALLASAAETRTGRADIALINAGCVRANIKPGEIVVNDALTVMPNYDTVCITEVSGQTILDELEHGVRTLPKLDGGFLHASGLSYTIDTRIPSPVKIDDTNIMIGIDGERRVSNVKIHGEDIDPAKTYRVVSSEYVIRERGNGHVFRDAKVIETGYMILSDALAHYLRKFDYLPERYSENQGRITVIQ